MMFLNDGWGTNKSFDLTQSDALIVRKRLLDAGFVINEGKSVLILIRV